jgi:hypothetical protein
MRQEVNRRIFLRGLGGAVVAAPFLGSIGNPGVKAQSAAAPRRLIVMFTHYGCLTNRWFPTNSHGALTQADLDATTLKHLSPYVGKVLIPRGIRAMNEWTADMTRGQGNDYHTQVVGTYFTCQPVTPNSNDPFSFDSTTKFNAMPVGPSLDHVIAQQLSPSGIPLFMRVANQSDSPQSGISYSAAVTPFSGLGTHVQAFNGLTGLFSGGPVSADTYQAIRGKSLVDLVKDDLDTLQRFDMSQSDKMKLDAWKQLLHETGVMVSAQCNADVASTLGATQANVDASEMNDTGLGTDRLAHAITNTMDGADLFSAIATLAAVCNANPVIFLKYPASYVFKGLGLNIESASLSGRIGNAGSKGTCVTGVLDMIAKVDDYYSQKFAKLVGMLDGISEGDGTVLDNTAAVWFQEMSDGCAHNLNNLPIVEAGGRAATSRRALP